MEIDESDDEYFARDDNEKLLIKQNIRKSKAAETQIKPLKPRSNTQSEEKNTLKCNVCGTSFSRKDNLSRHMRNKHK